MDIKIRRARRDEAGVLTELSLRSKRSNGYGDAFMAACREELTVTGARMSQGEYWVAEAQGAGRSLPYMTMVTMAVEGGGRDRG